MVIDGYFLHVFGKFLHPQLLKPIIDLGTDSVDGSGYIFESSRGYYIKHQEYHPIRSLNQTQVAECPCSVCQDCPLEVLQVGDINSQLLLVRHNIQALIYLKKKFEQDKQEKKEPSRHREQQIHADYPIDWKRDD